MSAGRPIFHLSVGVGPHRRRGVAIVQLAVAVPMLLTFAALTVDIGRICLAKNQLQVAADAAALAGSSGFLTDPGLVSTLPDVLRRNNDEVQAIVRERARSFALKNPTFGKGTYLENSDIVLGTYDAERPQAPLDTSGALPFNAVQVTIRMGEGEANGPIDFLFARVFGRRSGGISATATAVMDDRFSRYEPPRENTTPLIPVGIHKDVYEYLAANGPDVYSFDESDRAILSSGDSIGEVILFPWKWFGNGDSQDLLDSGIITPDPSGEGGGNYGFLDFGPDQSSANELSAQITNGISREDLQVTLGTQSLDFVDDAGNPVSYPVSGAPGLKVNTADAFAGRLGQIVGFFLYDLVQSDGTNCTYRVVGVRFGRVMHVDLQGSPKTKAVIVQPAAYSGDGVGTGNAAPPTGGQVGRLALVK